MASARSSRYKGYVLPNSIGADPMAKPGRNDPCHCGSGNKYKKCCQPKDDAVALAAAAEAQTQRDAHAAEQRAHDRALRAEVIARLSRAEAEDVYDDELDVASNAVVTLVKAGKLDEAEAASRALQARFPEVHDGWDRLGLGSTKPAAMPARRPTAIAKCSTSSARIPTTPTTTNCARSTPASSPSSTRSLRPERQPALARARRWRRSPRHRQA